MPVQLRLANIRAVLQPPFGVSYRCRCQLCYCSYVATPVTKMCIPNLLSLLQLWTLIAVFFTIIHLSFRVVARKSLQPMQGSGIFASGGHWGGTPMWLRMGQPMAVHPKWQLTGWVGAFFFPELLLSFGAGWGKSTQCTSPECRETWTWRGLWLYEMSTCK